MLWEIENTKPGGWLYDVTASRRLSYQDIGDTVVSLEQVMKGNDKALVALVADNSTSCLACYLAALRCGHAVMLLNAFGDRGLRDGLLSLYQPEFLFIPQGNDIPEAYITDSECNGFICAVIKQSSQEKIHPDTAVLLPSSGTTGNPKLIRLSYRNIQSNAEAIASYLEICANETAITSLPFSYSYGFSVVNSHLFAGGNLVCTDLSVVTRQFWQLFKEFDCTSFAGVPYSYLTLERLRFEKMTLPSLRTMTQAGGHLAQEKVLQFAEMAKKNGIRFFVMYGQTEAAPRIAYVPWERLHEKAGSVGISIPGGLIRVSDEGKPNLAPNEEGEVIYEGPNVMMGYAENRKDLAKGDELGGVLSTGDIGYQDSEGYLFITGRLKRFIKIFGLRLNLDDVEKMLEAALALSVACVGRDDLLHLLIESLHDKHAQEARQKLSSLYHIHHSALKVHLTSSIPVTISGKKDYPTIERELKLNERP